MSSTVAKYPHNLCLCLWKIPHRAFFHLCLILVVANKPQFKTAPDETYPDH